jgi:hypothetical protein
MEPAFKVDDPAVQNAEMSLRAQNPHSSLSHPMFFPDSCHDYYSIIRAKNLPANSDVRKKSPLFLQYMDFLILTVLHDSLCSHEKPAKTGHFSSFPIKTDLSFHQIPTI